MFKASLKARKSCHAHASSSRTDPSAPIRYSVLTKEEMIKRMKKLHDELRRLKKQRDRLTKKVEMLVERNTITLNKKDHEDMLKIISDEGHMATANMNMFQKIFWEQQVAAAKKADHRGMRWHPLMIRWCILLRHQSPGAYETLRDCLRLPSQRNLRDYTHHVKAKPGFCDEVDSQLYAAAELDKCEERDKHVLLLIDEMYVKEDLVFDKTTGDGYQ